MDLGPTESGRVIVETGLGTRFNRRLACVDCGHFSRCCRGGFASFRVCQRWSKVQGGPWTFLVARSKKKKKKQVHAWGDAEEVSVSDSGMSEQFHSCMRNRFSSQHVGIRIKQVQARGNAGGVPVSGSGTLKRFQCFMWNRFLLRHVSIRNKNRCRHGEKPGKFPFLVLVR